jgi:hypothetical protein
MVRAVGVGLLMSLAGAYALNDNPVGIRTVYLVILNLVGAAIDMLAYRLAWRFEWTRGRYWHRVLLATVLVVVPLGILTWGSTWLLGRNLPVSALLIVFVNTFAISGAFIAAFVGPAMDPVLRPAPRPADTVSVAETTHFMERLPRHLRTAELWAVKAEDHYLSALTSGGDALIRLRMADAMRELATLHGAQTHRSWWVARSAVRSVRRGEGRVSLLLPDGREAPVSRAYARDLRSAGWL